ncbi:MAG: phosphoribosylformylglycinamidine cyclo-ligase [Candidatus Omnitrophota bacterium]|nr:MAG: phosphoribosylformylglycinamidine cyclo-ligase [Candidatus Omnitrophota bacterium]
MVRKKLTYKSCGVDIKKGENLVDVIKKLFPERRMERISAFGSFFPLKKVIEKYKNPLLVSSCDGVGTKLKIAQYLNYHRSVGIDLVAMNVNDIICLGATPLFFSDYIACGKLNILVLREVLIGIKKALREASCFLIGGETAEMPGMYKKDEYDLAGFCLGVVSREKIIDGRSICEGNLLVGLASNGLHSNGFSLVRRVFSKKEIKYYAQQLLKPTRIYVRAICNLLNNKRYFSKIKGIAHITGGAFYTKFTKIIPPGYGAIVKRGSWSVPKIFKIIQEKANIDDREMYSVFNMGIGMVLVVDRKSVKKIVNTLRKFYPVYIIGEVIKAKEKIKFV